MTTPATREEVETWGAKVLSLQLTGYELSALPLDKPELRALVKNGHADINDPTQHDMREASKAYLTMLRQLNLALVPVEATEAMIDGADKALNAWRQGLPADEKMLRRKFVHGAAFTEATVPEKHAIRYRAMLAASPYNKETGT